MYGLSKWKVLMERCMKEKILRYNSNLAQNIPLTLPRWHSLGRTSPSTRMCTATATYVCLSWQRTGRPHSLSSPSASPSSACWAVVRRKSGLQTTHFMLKHVIRIQKKRSGGIMMTQYETCLTPIWMPRLRRCWTKPSTCCMFIHVITCWEGGSPLENSSRNLLLFVHSNVNKLLNFYIISVVTILILGFDIKFTFVCWIWFFWFFSVTKSSTMKSQFYNCIRNYLLIICYKLYILCDWL